MNLKYIPDPRVRAPEADLAFRVCLMVEGWPSVALASEVKGKGMDWTGFPEVTGKTNHRGDRGREVKGSRVREAQNHSTKRKQPDIKGHLSYDSIYVNRPEEGSRKSMSGCWALG